MVVMRVLQPHTCNGVVDPLRQSGARVGVGKVELVVRRVYLFIHLLIYLFIFFLRLSTFAP